MQDRDPDAAALLMAQLLVTQEVERKRQESGGGLQAFSNASVYNPMALFAYVALKTGWSHRDMLLMHYITFFAYVREFLEHDRREQDATKAPFMAMPATSQYPSNRAIDF